MSENIGGIIKFVAVILCVLGIVVSVVGAFTLNLGFGGLISGCGASLLTGLFVYGFGQLIDDTAMNRQINQQLLQYLMAKEREKKEADAPRDVPVAFSSERRSEGARPRTAAAGSAIGWTCEKCGTRNGNSDISCKDCGAYK